MDIPEPKTEDDQHVLQAEVERLRAENALLRAAPPAETEEAKRNRLIVETAQEGIWIIDAKAKTTFVNPRMAEMLGYTVTEMLGQPVQAFMDTSMLPTMETNMERRRSGVREQHDFRFLRKDGSSLWTLISTNPLMDEDGNFTGALAYFTDITERVQVAKDLELTHRRLAFHVENSPLAVIETGPDFTIQRWSSGAERIFGWTAEEMLGKPLQNLKFIHEDDLEEVREISSHLREGRVQRNRFANRNYNNKGEVVYCEWFNSVLYDTEDQMVSILSLVMDVSDRRRLESQLLLSQKLESVGRLAGGIAHDFNNMLTAIIGYAELLEEELDKETELHTYATHIRAAAERSADLTSQLLAFARRQVIMPRVVNLNDLIRDVDAILRRLISENISLRPLLKPDVSNVRVDPGQFGQVLINLVINARDAMPDGGKLLIETDNVTLGEEVAAARPEIVPGDYVLLAVSDTGEGISPEALPYIFEPFYTTKATARGTGLGLATCYGIVRQNGGHIGVYSEPGMGTTFKVYLPAVYETPIAIPHTLPVVLPNGDETILLVEDEELVLDFAERTLRSRGYHVLRAKDGNEGLKVASEYKGTIQLLLTDVVMPEMSGTQLAEHLLAARPGIKVIYMSGYTENTVIQRGILEEGFAFLQKPCSPLVLANKVRETLDAGDREQGTGNREH